MIFLVCILVADNVLLCVMSRQKMTIYTSVFASWIRRDVINTRIIFSPINGPIKCFCLRLEQTAGNFQPVLRASLKGCSIDGKLCL